MAQAEFLRTQLPGDVGGEGSGKFGKVSTHDFVVVAYFAKSMENRIMGHRIMPAIRHDSVPHDFVFSLVAPTVHDVVD
jgi:hypothetical protein